MLWWWPTGSQGSLREKVKGTAAQNGKFVSCQRSIKLCRTASSCLQEIKCRSWVSEWRPDWRNLFMLLDIYYKFKHSLQYSYFKWLNPKTYKNRWLIIVESVLSSNELYLPWRVTAKVSDALTPYVASILNPDLKEQCRGSEIYVKAMCTSWCMQHKFMCYVFLSQGLFSACLCRSNLAGNIWALHSQEIAVTEEFTF